jgi:hypothetical protein
LIERQPVGGGSQSLVSKAQQEPERVTIRAYGMAANSLLLHQALREETLQQGWELLLRGLHRGLSQ